MKDFGRERRSKREDRRKITARIRQLDLLRLKHLLSLSVSLVLGCMAFFAFLNTKASWTGPMMLLDVVLLFLVLWLLLSEAEK